METPLIEVHRAAGARIGEYSGVALPEAFSDLEREYAAARESVALFDTNWHAMLELTGRDRVKYLHAISSNNIHALETGQGTLALLLNPQGRIQAELEVYALAEKLLVRTHASLRDQSIALLKKYVIGSQVKIEDATDAMGSMAIEGPRAAAIVEQACGVRLEDLPELAIRDATIEGIGCQLVRRSHFGEIGAEFLVGRDCVAPLWGILLAGVRAHGGEPIGTDALNTLRLEAGVPWFPADFNDGMIPHEAVLENTHISFNKGCYTGQEIVERVRTRGHVNRKRVGLKFSTVAPPPSGTKLRAGGAEIGFVTTAAFSRDAKPAIGMGYVRREHFATGSVVEFDGGTAEVRENLQPTTKGGQ
jgi:folate-binding protein YgfZ